MALHLPLILALLQQVVTRARSSCLCLLPATDWMYGLKSWFIVSPRFTGEVCSLQVISYSKLQQQQGTQTRLCRKTPERTSGLAEHLSIACAGMKRVLIHFMHVQLVSTQFVDTACSIISQQSVMVVVVCAQAASGELREQAAEGLGELVDITSEETLKPFVVQITGQLPM